MSPSDRRQTHPAIDFDQCPTGRARVAIRRVAFSKIPRRRRSSITIVATSAVKSGASTRATRTNRHDSSPRLEANPSKGSNPPIPHRAATPAQHPPCSRNSLFDSQSLSARGLLRREHQTKDVASRRLSLLSESHRRRDQSPYDWHREECPNIHTLSRRFRLTNLNLLPTSTLQSLRR